MKVTTGQKIVLVFVAFSIALIGFMMRLPSAFRHYDKELHSLFYFGAALFLNLLFAQGKLLRHAAIFIMLYLFGLAIEWSQAWSNQFFRRRIHGRFDPEDVQANLYGLIFFSALWIIATFLFWLYKKGRKKSNVPL